MTYFVVYRRLPGMGRMRHTAVPLVGHKISMTGELVRYGVETSQLVLDVISFQWRESKSWLKRHGGEK
jgi:hypothetical protein